MHATTAVLMLLLGADQFSDIQGTWQSTDHFGRYTLVVCDDQLAIQIGTHPTADTRVSGFSIDPDQGTIDIKRDDGVQLGRYAIEGDKLTMMLADVNRPRPESVNFPLIKNAHRTIDRKTWKPPAQQQHIFERAR